MSAPRSPSIEMLADLIHFDKYAKYLPQLQRREVYSESTNRCESMHQNHFLDFDVEDEISEAFKFVHDKKVLPSMRSMQFAGKPIELSNNRIFNCAALPIDNIHAFAEVMFLLLGGTGVGYSVQKKHVRRLPRILGPLDTEYKYVISDDIAGWSNAVLHLMKAYTRNLHKPRFVYDDIRQKGARLVTSGGKAPGPEPLRRALEAVEGILDGAIGRKLTPLEVHDICCHIADAVLAGGIRRAAMISLFSLSDDEMIRCKGNYKVVSSQIRPALINSAWKAYDVTVVNPVSGETEVHTLTLDSSSKYDKPAIEAIKTEGALPWWRFEPQRGRANNSATVVRYRIKKKDFFKFWKAVQESGSGDPGIFFTNDSDWLTNPCGEVALRCENSGGQFCNLVEINTQGVVDQEDLNERARMAARIGTMQAAYTDFHYIRPIWKEHTEKDALLGISLTGLANGDVDHLDLEEAVQAAIEENERFAAKIGINPAARVTCVKPSGTAALILGTSSGIHAWFAKYYLRRLRMDKSEPLYHYLKSETPQLIEDIIEDPTGKSACVKIPIKAPEGAITAQDETALEFLERVSKIQKKWVIPGHNSGDNRHNVSATVYVDEHEWDEVGEWMWKNREFFTGLSVLPKDGGTHIQAPFEECDQETYEELMQYAKTIDLKNVIEDVDLTDLKGELACAGGACEI